MRNLSAWFCAAAALPVMMLQGCSFSVGNTTPTISKDILQEDLSKRFTELGETPQSVTCKDDLLGEVGSTARCDVTLSETNSFEVIVSTTGVEGSTVNYDTEPALTKEQVEKFVTAQVESDAQQSVSSVDCESGLEGDVGTIVYCDVVTTQAQPLFAVELSDVEGLLMSVEAMPVLTKAEVETSLANELERQFGYRPPSITCVDELIGKPGNTTDCTASDGTDTASFTLTVTSVDGLNINYDLQPTN